ncbi:hypothetical protein Taiwan902_04240 [Helicobacter pylori]
MIAILIALFCFQDYDIKRYALKGFMVKTEKEVQKQVIETFKSMGYAYLGDLTKSDNENINKH